MHPRPILRVVPWLSAALRVAGRAQTVAPSAAPSAPPLSPPTAPTVTVARGTIIDDVKQGQALAAVDASTLQKQIAQQQAAVAAAQRALEADRAQADVAQSAASAGSAGATSRSTNLPLVTAEDVAADAAAVQKVQAAADAVASSTAVMFRSVHDPRVA